MPSYLVTAPDGRKFRVSGQGTADEALAHFQQQYAAQPASFGERFDAPEAGGGALAPDQVRQAGRRAVGNPDRGAWDAAMRGAADMASFGFGDEISAGLRSGFGMAGDYEKELAGVRARNAQAAADHPVAHAVGELAGVAPMMAIPGLNVARGASLGVRVGRGLVAGAGIGGLQGAGSADGGLEDRAMGAASGAAIGAGIGGVAPLVGRAIGNIVGRRAGRAAVPTTDALKAQSQALYDAAGKSGVRIAPQSFSRAVNTLSQDVRAKGIDPSIHPKSWAALGRLEQAAGGQLDIGEMETLRRVLKSAAMSIDPSERYMAGRMIGRLDDFMSNLKPADVVGGDPRAAVTMLQQARSLWSRQAKGDLIETAFRNAGDAKSGLESGLRSEFGKLLKSPKHNWTADERQALRQVVRGGLKANALRFFGTFGYSPDQARSFLGTIIGGGTGAALFGPVGAVGLPAAGTAARFASRALAKSRAKELSALVRNGGAAPIDTAAAERAGGLASLALSAGGRVATPSLADFARRFAGEDGPAPSPLEITVNRFSGQSR